jgi:hypothetical protein
VPIALRGNEFTHRFPAARSWFGSASVTFYFLKRTILFVDSGCWTNVYAILATISMASGTVPPRFAMEAIAGCWSSRRSSGRD